jgi:Flp pilus assembly protein TadG
MIRRNQVGKISHKRRGSEILELAFLMLPLLWLTFGAIAIDYGFYFYMEHNLQGAAREGVRAGVPASVTDPVAAAKDGVQKIMSNAGFKNPTQYTVTVSNTTVGSATAMTVTVEMPYTAIGIPPARVPATKVKGTATMIFEGY